MVVEGCRENPARVCDQCYSYFNQEWVSCGGAAAAGDQRPLPRGPDTPTSLMRESISNLSSYRRFSFHIHTEMPFSLQCNGRPWSERHQREDVGARRSREQARAWCSEIRALGSLACPLTEATDLCLPTPSPLFQPLLLQSVSAGLKTTRSPTECWGLTYISSRRPYHSGLLSMTQSPHTLSYTQFTRGQISETAHTTGKTGQGIFAGSVSLSFFHYFWRQKRVKLSACGHMSQSSYPKAKLLRLLCVLWTDLNRSQMHVCVSFNMNFFIIVYHGVYWPDRKEDVPCLYQFLWPWHTTVSLLVGVREITHLSFCWDLKWAVNKDSFTQQSLSSNHFSLEEFLFWWEDSQNTDHKALW